MKYVKVPAEKLEVTKTAVREDNFTKSLRTDSGYTGGVMSEKFWEQVKLQTPETYS